MINLETHGYGYKYHTRAREEVLMVEALPDRVSSSFTIRIQTDLTNDPCHDPAKW